MNSNDIDGPTVSPVRHPRRPILRGAARWSITILVVVAVALSTAWASLALFYRLPAPVAFRNAAAIVFALVGFVVAVALLRRLRFAPVIFFLLVFGAVVVWWATIRPSSEGDWAADVARQVTGTIDGDMLTLTNVRNFSWNADGTSVDRWETRGYDLRTLKTLDLIMSYWAGPQMAHMILSFGFGDGQYVAWSIEVRRSRGGAFSPLGDLFKSNPLVIVAADERDVVRVRSNVRGEDVQLFRMNVPPPAAQRLLLQYVAEANDLASQPQFYNSLTTNCTTTATKMMRAVGARFPLDWRLIVNGYLPDFAYERGVLDVSVPFSQIKNAAHIKARAMEAGDAADFSARIRANVPSPVDN